jgi:hypothetical protein
VTPELVTLSWVRPEKEELGPGSTVASSISIA